MTDLEGALASPAPRSKVNPALRKRVILRDGLRCYLCGDAVVDVSGPPRQPNHLTLDHVVPVAAGGRNRMDNLRVCCRSCNTHKGSSVDFTLVDRLAAEDRARERKQARKDLRRLFGLAMFLADMTYCQPIRKARTPR